MTNTRHRLRQISLRTLLILTLFAGIFATGFRKGYSEVTEFERLIYLIETTVVPDTWEVLGGPAMMAPYPQNTTYCPTVVTDDGGEGGMSFNDLPVGDAEATVSRRSQ